MSVGLGLVPASPPPLLPGPSARKYSCVLKFGATYFTKSMEGWLESYEVCLESERVENHWSYEVVRNLHGWCGSVLSICSAVACPPNLGSFKNKKGDQWIQVPRSRVSNIRLNPAHEATGSGPWSQRALTVPVSTSGPSSKELHWGQALHCLYFLQASHSLPAVQAQLLEQQVVEWMVGNDEKQQQQGCILQTPSPGAAPHQLENVPTLQLGSRGLVEVAAEWAQVSATCPSMGRSANTAPCCCYAAKAPGLHQNKARLFWPAAC